METFAENGHDRVSQDMEGMFHADGGHHSDEKYNTR